MESEWLRANTNKNKISYLPHTSTKSIDTAMVAIKFPTNMDIVIVISQTLILINIDIIIV